MTILQLKARDFYPFCQQGDYFLEVDSLGAGDAVVRFEHRQWGPGWLRFTEPEQVVCARELEEVVPVLRQAETASYAVGFLTYEASPAFDRAMEVRPRDWPVLAWFALYAKPPTWHRELAPVYGDVQVDLAKPEMDFEAYASVFERVKEALAEGSTYQVNLTFRQRFRADASPARFFAQRCGVSPPEYATFIDGGEWQVASFSPELFFLRSGDEVEIRPMKGTAPAPLDRGGIVAAAAEMANDPKSRAENVMIVDMVRNDLGRVAEPGTVRTEALLEVERHRGLLQMTSTVRADVTGTSSELLKNVFPAASITGAPKVETMRLIRELETSPRHLYCGAIGVLTPKEQRMSVAIRTALFRGEEAEFGIGSGVVWDSDARAEYDECLAKRDFLLRGGDPWCLVEALPAYRLGEPEYVARHLERLRGQAAEFGIPFDEAELVRLLDNQAQTAKEARIKVRIALRRDGSFSVRSMGSALPPGRLRAALGSTPVQRADPNMRRKTNSRAVLDRHLDEHPDVDEVLLYNEDGELTEFCRGNLVVRRGRELLTPCPESGCLRGIGVAQLVESGAARYAVLRLEELATFEALFLWNSVVDGVEVSLIPPT